MSRAAKRLTAVVCVGGCGRTTRAWSRTCDACSRKLGEASDRVAWDCSICGIPIDDNDGYLWVSVRDAVRALEAEQEWKTRHGSVVTIEELFELPDPVPWVALHRGCDPRPEDEGYAIDVSRLRSSWDIVRWTCHLSGKNWLRATDWHEVVGHAADRNGARHP
jgi:hypothetical protein